MSRVVTALIVICALFFGARNIYLGIQKDRAFHKEMDFYRQSLEHSRQHYAPDK
jgi:hypothetical protein